MAHLSIYVSALAAGLVIGLERERSQSGPARLAYGIRTFTLLGLVGALAAQAGGAAVAVGLAGVGALVVAGYRRTNETDPGTTTEVAALATYLLGVLAWRDATLAVALGLVVVVLLMGKARLHRFVSEVLSDAEIEDALKFLIGAFVVLPLLPHRDLGPYGIFNPARIWFIVVAVTGVSWIGYIAVRVLGARRGLRVAGLAGGFVSALATTASMARRARTSGDLAGAVSGALGASVATFVELAVIITALSAPVGARILVACALGALGLGVGALSSRIRRRGPRERAAAVHPTPSRVITLVPALSLAGIISATLLVARWAAAHFGARGVVLAVALAGLGDAHGGSITAVTLYARGALSLSGTLVAIGAAVSANTLVKCVVAYAMGGSGFLRRFAPGVAVSLGLFIAGLGLVLWIAP